MKKLAIIASLLVTAVAVCAEATQADASRKATRSERAAILHELRITRDDPLPYPKGSYRYVVRVSTVSRRYAAVFVRPTRGNEDVVQPDAASFRRLRNREWRVIQIGNGGGCEVPRSVRRDLKLSCY